MGVHDALPSLAAAVESIRRQTFGDFEFLVIDDASTDGSLDVLRGHAAADPRIRLIAFEKNLGLGAVLERGVREARAPLIARMDADDVSVPGRLARQAEYFRAHPGTDVLGGYALDVDAQGRPVRERRVPIEPARIAALVWTNPFVHSTVMFRREAVLGVGSYDASLRRRQDYDLWFRCVAAGLALANLPEPLVHYQFSEDTMRRSSLRAMREQVRIGLRGCRRVRAPFHAYVGTCLPLLEAALPPALRLRLAALKARVDPRAAS
jgi:glycosyltransferase involved in cell wall biosynthesis